MRTGNCKFAGHVRSANNQRNSEGKELLTVRMKWKNEKELNQKTRLFNLRNMSYSDPKYYFANY